LDVKIQFTAGQGLRMLALIALVCVALLWILVKFDLIEPLK